MVDQYPRDSFEHVVLHALWQESRGRSPSLSIFGVKNPKKALAWAKRYAYFPIRGKYLAGETPDNYICSDCGASGCKLWRIYQTFVEHQVLRCAKCAALDQGKDISDIDSKGKSTFYLTDKNGAVYPMQKTDSIGWLVPAVPTEENDSFWGYTSVPFAGCNWWKNLPTHPATT